MQTTLDHANVYHLIAASDLLTSVIAILLRPALAFGGAGTFDLQA